MAKFEDIEIGGMEYGPVQFQHNGDLRKAKALNNKARTLLGDLKRRMQLGGIKHALDKKEYPDGTVIEVASNRAGLADQDFITIFSPLRGGGIVRCVGYIVQGFTDDNYQYVMFKLTGPGDKNIPYSLDPDMGIVRSADLTQEGVDYTAPYTDHHAKYIDRYKNGVVTEYQEVFLNFEYFGSSFDLKGPNTYQGVPLGDGATSPLFVGDVSIDYLYNTDLVIQVYYGTLIGYVNYTYVDAIPTYQLNYTTPASPWSDLGITQSDWLIHANNYVDINYTFPALIPILNEADIGPYNDAVNSFDIGAPVGYSYKSLFHTGENGFSLGTGGAIQRRKDSRGFVTNMGFEFVSNDPEFIRANGSGGGVVFHDTGQGFGEGALFMMPYLGDTKNLKIAKDIRDFQVSLGNESVDIIYTGGVLVYSIGTEAEPWGPDIPGPGAANFTYANIDPSDSEGPAPNIIKTNFDTWTPTDVFGIPNSADSGLHRINVKRTSTSKPIKKLKIYALIQGAQFSGMAIKEIPQTDIVLSSTETEWSKEINIKVGEDVPFNQIESLISIV